jgi:hypothetical protein
MYTRTRISRRNSNVSHVKNPRELDHPCLLGFSNAHVMRTVYVSIAPSDAFVPKSRVRTTRRDVYQTVCFEYV